MKLDIRSSSDHDRAKRSIRLLLAEGRPIVRESMTYLFARWPDFELVAVAADAREVLVSARQLTLDVVVLSMSTRGRGFFDLIKRVRALPQDPPIVVIGGGSESTLAVRALRAGVRGFLSDDGTPGELAAAVRAASAGELYVSRSLGSVLSYLLEYPQDTPEHARLSNREYEVLCLLGAGKAISSIAPQLGLSSKTISTYRSRLMRKLNLKNSAELIRYAIENDLIAEASGA